VERLKSEQEGCDGVSAPVSLDRLEIRGEQGRLAEEESKSDRRIFSLDRYRGDWDAGEQVAVDAKQNKNPEIREIAKQGDGLPLRRPMIA